MTTRDLKALREARTAIWAEVGEVDSDLLADAENTNPLGGAVWPAGRQAFRRVETPRNTVIYASDGLSDPFGEDDGPEVGLGLEVFLETPAGSSGSAGDPLKDWQFLIVHELAHGLAQYGPLVTDQFHRFGVLSMALPVPDAPADWKDPAGEVGVLIGAPAADVPATAQLPTGEILILPVTPLRPAELAVVVKGGAGARIDLVDRLREAGHGHLSDPNRPAV